MVKPKQWLVENVINIGEKHFFSTTIVKSKTYYIYAL